MNIYIYIYDLGFYDIWKMVFSYLVLMYFRKILFFFMLKLWEIFKMLKFCRKMLWKVVILNNIKLNVIIILSVIKVKVEIEGLK